MKLDVVTIFPRMVEAPLAEGVVGRAIQRGLLDLCVRDLREYTTDRHRSVDDEAFGGGPGMVMTPGPFFRAVEAIEKERGVPSTVILTSPDGRLFTHREAIRLAALEHIVLLCGRYEGVDARVRLHLATEALSIGDYVVSGGELPALVIVDAVARLVPGVVGDGESVARDTFARGILDFPQYTRPADFRGLKVPAVLLSGHHAEIDRWRRREALARTLRERPDLLASATLDAEDQKLLRELLELREKGAS